MTYPKSSCYLRYSERRSRLDRRWIKAHYPGEDRRSGKERRSKLALKGLNRNLPASDNAVANKLVGLEKLTVSSTIQLEAVTRLLLEKGIIEESGLLAMMQKVQAEYQHRQKID